MTVWPGVAFLASLVYLVLALSTVYSIAQEPFKPVGHLVRQTARRAAKLFGVLAVLALLVGLLSGF